MDPNMPIIYMKEEMEEPINYPPPGVKYRDMLYVMQPSARRAHAKENVYKSHPKQAPSQYGRHSQVLQNLRLIYRTPGCPYKDSEYLSRLTQDNQEDIKDEPCDIKPSREELNEASPEVPSESCYTNSNHYKRREYFTCLSFMVDISKDRLDKIVKKYNDTEMDLMRAKEKITQFEQNKHVLPRKVWLKPEYSTEEDIRMIRFHEADMMGLQRDVDKIKKQLEDLDNQVQAAREKYVNTKRTYDSCFGKK